MRKNSPRKWLHATLDLLPVILIPVFMIYSHRHTIDSGSIQVPQNEIVDFNQLSPQIQYRFDNTRSTHFELFSFSTENNHKYYLKQDYSIVATDGGADTQYQTILTDFNGSSIYNLNLTEEIILSSNSISNCEFVIYFYDNAYLSLVLDVNVYDLTQMFGSGNEPSIQEFNSWYDGYYNFTLSHKELLQVGSTTYDDSDIMSQITYQLYNAVDKYFNMGNVFNMTSVYDWFAINIFNGNIPVSIYIVWNIVLYEFVMDLLFLLYGLFMWFIDMVEHLMEKPFKSIK